MKKDIKLYDMFFPFVFLLEKPLIWLIVFPVNLAINFMVVAITMKFLKTAEIFKAVKKILLKVTLFGIAADIIGSGILVTVKYLCESNAGESESRLVKNIAEHILSNPFANVFAFLTVLIVIGVSGVLIYYWDYNFAFKGLDIETKKRKKLALVIAIITSPYMLFIPSFWFYTVLS